ncbi:MAG: STAS domain-containing protein [Herpetosiphon sp.]
MDLEVSEHITRIIIISPRSRVDAFNSATLRATLEKYLDEHVIKFVVDLSQVPFLDSAGMAVLVSLLKRCRQAGGDVKLVWPNEEAAQRILRLTKFDRVFQMSKNAPDALATFLA